MALEGNWTLTMSTPLGERKASLSLKHIPVEVAADICKYRYGRLKFEWGMPQFTRLDFR